MRPMPIRGWPRGPSCRRPRRPSALGGDLDPAVGAGRAHRGDPRGVRGGRRAAGGSRRRGGPGGRPCSPARRAGRRFRRSPTALDLRLRTDLLVPLSRWVTPASMPRRFDARFFAAAFPAGAAVTLVGDEVSAQAWHRPLDALESMAAGGLGMWLPTSTTLMQLAHADSIDDIAARLAPGRLGEVVVEDVADDVVRIEMPAGGGVAGQPVNAYLVGRAAFVLVDPGDPTGRGARPRGGGGAGAGRAHRGGRPDPRRCRPCRRRGGDRRAARGAGARRARAAGDTCRTRPASSADGEVIDAGDVAAAGRGDARAAAGSRRRSSSGRGVPSIAGDLDGGAARGRSSGRRTRLRGSGPWQLSVPWRRARAGCPATAPLLRAIRRQRRRQVPEQVEALVDLLGRRVGPGHQEARPAGHRDADELTPRFLELAAGRDRRRRACR